MIEGPDQIPLIHKQDNISVADQCMAVLGKPMSRRDDPRSGDIRESVRQKRFHHPPARPVLPGVSKRSVSNNRQVKTSLIYKKEKTDEKPNGEEWS